MNRYQSLSKVPLLICQDAEWGLSMRLDETLRFPRNMTLGAIQDEQLIYDMGKEVGRQCKALGIHVNFAPVVDVNNNPANPVINDRSFGEDKERVARLGALFAQGLGDAGVLACAKHFPGHGDTAVDSHHALPIIRHPKSHIEELELYPFIHLINQGIPAIMNAHVVVPALDDTPKLPSSLSYKIVTELLKHKLGFIGLVVSDDLGMRAVTDHFKPGDIEVRALLAGTDIILCPLDVPLAIDLIEKAVRDNVISEQEIDAKVLKVLHAKEWAGSHKNRFVEEKEALSSIVSEKAQGLKKELYEKAVTVVRNQSAFPVTKDTVVIQIGGTKEQPFTHAFSTAYYLSANVGRQEIDQLLEKVGTVEKVVIGVLEMTKFSRENFGLSESTLAVIKELRQKGKQVILALFGNPYSLRNFGEEAAIIVAYEDDPDAQRAAVKVILGSLTAQGRLPVTASEKFKVGLGL